MEDLRTYGERKKGWWIEENAIIPCALPKDGLIVVFKRSDAEEIMDQHYPFKGKGNRKVWYFNSTLDREIAEIDAEDRISANLQVLYQHFLNPKKGKTTMSSLIMLEKKDNRAPDDYMEKVLKEYNTCWGVLTIDLPTAKSDSISAKDTAPTLEDIKDIRTACDDPAVSIAYWFCKSDKEVHPDSMQPFVIVKDDAENPLVVALAAGEFKTYVGDGAISGAYYYCNDYLNAQFEDLMERASGDIEKLDAEVSKKSVMSNLKNSLDDGDWVILAIADEKGSVHFISKTAINIMDWGFTSDILGWEKQEHQTTDTVVEETRGLTGMAARVAAAKAKKQANLGSTEKPADTRSVTTFVPTPTITGTKTQDKLTPPKGATPDTHPQWFYRPDSTWAEKAKDKQIMHAYQGACGYCPDDYKDLPWTVRKVPKSVTQEPLKDFSGLRQIASVDPSKSNAEGAPIITQQSLQYLTEEIIPKYYDVGKRLIKDPWKAPDLEKKISFLSDLTGLGDQILGAPVALRRDLIKDPNLIINWSVELTAEVLRLKKENNDLRAKIVELGARHLKTA